MKVLYLHQYFNTPAMSGGTRSYEFARRLVESGHEVHMITSDRESSGSIYETDEGGIRVTWIPVKYSNSMGLAARIKAFISFAVKSSRVAANCSADLVFATSTPLTIAIPGVYAKGRRRIPLVFEVRDLWPSTPIGLGVLTNPILKWLALALEKFAYFQSDQIVALSEDMKTGVVKTGYPVERVVVIPNASDIDRFSVEDSLGEAFRADQEWLGCRPLVLYAGTLGFANDVSFMVHLAAETMQLDPQIRFLIVGGGRDTATVQALARKRGVLNNNLFMMEKIRKDEVATLFSAATITSSWVRNVPEMWANSANKFFDSLAASRPIVINHEGWQAELIRQTEVGLVLHPTDYLGAARALVAHIRDEAWLNKARTNARHLATERFSRDELYKHFEKTLKETLRESRGV